MIEQSTEIRHGLIKRIHVDMHRIRGNSKNGTNLPPLTVQAMGNSFKAHELEIDGPSKLIYNGDQLSCGARVWIETTAEVRTILHGS